MQFDPPLLKGTLIRRYKRFLSDIELQSGKEIVAHCPNPGSMLGCAIPGSPVLVSEAQNPKRKLKYTWELIDIGTTWVGVNPLRANTIVAEALRNGRIVSAKNFPVIRREVPYGKNSRADFVLDFGNSRTVIEVKSVTYVEKGIAMFPDAPTERGRKHLRELCDVVANGEKAIMIFLVQRQDTECFRPASHIHLEYAEDLRAAHEQGVEIRVYDCKIDAKGIFLHNEMAWDLDSKK